MVSVMYHYQDYLIIFIFMSPSSKAPCLGLLAEHSNCSFASGFLWFFGGEGMVLLNRNPITAFFKQIQLDDVRLWDTSYKICFIIS